MIKDMMGTKELQTSVNGIREELPAMRTAIIDQVRSDMKTEFNNAVQAYEVRIENKLKTFFEEATQLLETLAKPTNVVHAIEQREEELEKNGRREEILKKISVVYTLSKESIIIEKGVRGAPRLTEEGDILYKELTNTVMSMAKYHGSKSHSKIANSKIYRKFEDINGITQALEKSYIATSKGRHLQSVYADVIKRGLTAKFIKFLEKEFM